MSLMFHEMSKYTFIFPFIVNVSYVTEVNILRNNFVLFCPPYKLFDIQYMHQTAVLCTDTYQVLHHTY